MLRTVSCMLVVISGCLLAGCADVSDDREAWRSSLGQRTVAVVFDADDMVLDVVEISSDMEQIEFIAQEEGSRISVRVLGRNVDPSIPEGIKVSSWSGEWSSGKVSVDVNDGVVVSVQGNTLEQSSPMKPETIARIVKRLEEGSMEHSASVVIYRVDPALAELVEDGDGNLVPARIDPSLRDFLDRALPALRSGDREVLRSLIHSVDGELDEFQVDFYADVDAKDYQRFRLMRFTADHHSNRRNGGGNEGVAHVQASLPIEWKFTFSDSKDDRAMISYSVDLHIGRFGDGWRFVTFREEHE